MRKKIVNCEVCEKQLKTKVERIAHGQLNQRTISTSNEGVYLDEHKAWFCDSCWRELVKYHYDEKEVETIKAVVQPPQEPDLLQGNLGEPNGRTAALFDE